MISLLFPDIGLKFAIVRFIVAPDRAGGVDLVVVDPDRAGGVDRDGELKRAGVDLVDVAPDRTGGTERGGGVVVIDIKGAEVKGGASFFFERLRGGSFRMEDGCSGAP